QNKKKFENSKKKFGVHFINLYVHYWIAAMFRALYPYVNDSAGYLSCQEGDLFTVIQNDGDWILALNAYGQVGYIPGNYVTKKKGSNAEVLKFIDQGVEAIHYAATGNSGSYTHSQRETLQKLIEHRKAVVSQVEKRMQQSQKIAAQPKRHAPTTPPTPTTSADSVNGPFNNFKSGQGKQKSMKVAPPPPPGTKGPPPPPRTVNVPENNVTRPKAPAPQPPTPSEFTPDFTYNSAMDAPKSATATTNVPSKVEVPEALGQELIELVRRKSNLSHDASKSTIASVLSHIRTAVPSIGNVMDDIIVQLADVGNRNSKLESSHDAERLNVIFSEMAYCKDDSQQRSWSLHEDESVITEYLQELITILDNADPDIIRQVLLADDFEALETLVVFYQMETRVSIRLLLLKSFGALCGLSYEVLFTILNTVLPLELTRDIRTDLSSVEKVKYTGLVLTMLFCQGQQPPLHFYDHIDVEYVQYFLDTIDNPPEMDEGVSDILTQFLLSYNLHFKELEKNIVMKALANHGTAKVFTEKVLLLFNRGDDPVRMFDYEPKPPDSLMKLLTDIFSSKKTANIIYTNDAMVLIDIILRQITDLSSGDKLRTEYLSLMHLIIQKSDYEEHVHRRLELQSCFIRIYNEEGSNEQLQMDRYIIKQIWTDFPSYFNSS
ncbi:unnamed protein product, partial [Owenia fusiformis]